MIFWLGQHICEIKKDKRNEWRYLLEIEMEAMTTGLFDAVMADVAEEFIAYAAHMLDELEIYTTDNFR